MKRKPDESYEDYRERRKNETLETKDKLKGTRLEVINGKIINSDRIPRLKRQFYRLSKKFDSAGPLRKVRILKTATKIEKKLDVDNE